MASTLAEPTAPPRWYLGYIIVVYLIAIGGLGSGVIALYVNSQSATKQAECFQSFADRFSTVSTEVREAQVEVDAVESRTDRVAAKREDAFQGLLTLLLADPLPSEDQRIAAFKRLQATTADLAVARRELVRARNHLQAVRKNHPIPEAPDASGTCKLLPS